MLYLCSGSGVRESYMLGIWAQKKHDWCRAFLGGYGFESLVVHIVYFVTDTFCDPGDEFQVALTYVEIAVRYK